MKKPKVRKITNAMQEVASDCIISIGFCNTIEEVREELKKLEERYCLCRDPFTLLPCSSKEYAENSREYERQLAFELYGGCDWID